MMKYNFKKFVNATLFFAHRVKRLGPTKLNKLLYYSDFEHYRLYGRPILGDRYLRMKQGPVPDTSYSIFCANFREKIDYSLKDAIEIRRETLFSFTRNTIHPKREPDLSVFSESEIKIMEEVAEKWSDATARKISNQTHLEEPWRETPEHEKIDYKLTLKQPNSISREYAEYREEEDRLLESLLEAP